MRYSLEKLIRLARKNSQIEYLFFWGHTPNKDGSIGKSCLSQWWVAPFEVEGIVYPTAEHWMMAGKARLFGDSEMLEKIKVAGSAGEAKKLGRQVRNWDQHKWDSHRCDLVLDGNLHKFSQHDELKEFLLNTGGRVLVEASPRDSIWGIGMAASNEDAESPEKWRGLNLLGFALMEVRDMLRTESA